MDLGKDLEKALIELRKEKQRKFDQSVDLIINLQKFNPKKTSINLVISVPNKSREKKIGAFLETKNKNIETITPDEFKRYSDKKKMKKLVKKFDFFMAQASLMPKVATNFGKVLGPSGKMPSPQLGLLFEVNDKAIAETKEKINNSIKVRVVEPSIKLSVGKQSMENKKIIENAITIYNAILKEMPKEIENIKNIELKLTMTKPQKIRVR
ncbi:MAG: hypothetical protein KKF68_03835 [Nanoarchaeota archaeon]|nr:hypothetical protein [Nanoarchaeota archaeon]